MPNYKEVRLHLLDNSWRRRRVAMPPALVRAAGAYKVHLPSALLLIAVLTRPPVRYGFSLADTWAWMRYLPAIDASSGLRLCEAWSTLDPHQKAVLSGDFGVGFTALVLSKELQFWTYADVLWVVNVLAPGAFKLGRTAKRGPQKSPDYFALDQNLGISVIECKGTQASKESLKAAILRGVEQKKNVSMVGGGRFTHTLAAGLFVPQFERAEDATLMIADPEVPDLAAALQNRTKEQIVRAVLRVSYAKELALLDLARTANAVAGAPGSGASLREAMEQDRQLRRPERVRFENEVEVGREYRWGESRRIYEETFARGVRFTAKMEPARYSQLSNMDAIGDLESDLAQALSKDGGMSPKWTLSDDGMSSEYVSPFGSTFEVSFLRE